MSFVISSEISAEGTMVEPSSATSIRTFEAGERQRAFENLIEPWGRMVPEFREEGFYERFAARGQVERVSVIQRSLANAIGVGARATVERG